MNEKIAINTDMGISSLMEGDSNDDGIHLVDKSTIWIPTKTKARLKKLKIIPQEPYSRALERVLDFYEQNHPEPTPKKK